jgi:hypothetical protein
MPNRGSSRTHSRAISRANNRAHNRGASRASNRDNKAHLNKAPKAMATEREKVKGRDRDRDKDRVRVRNKEKAKDRDRGRDTKATKLNLHKQQGAPPPVPDQRAKVHRVRLKNRGRVGNPRAHNQVINSRIDRSQEGRAHLWAREKLLKTRGNQEALTLQRVTEPREVVAMQAIKQTKTTLNLRRALPCNNLSRL